MRIMSIDYGDVRTGVAFSDLTQMLAGEVLVLTEQSPKALAVKLAELAVSRDVGTVALGYPLNTDGSVGERALKTQKLANRLRAFGLHVDLVDERYTSFEAEEILRGSGTRKKRSVDAVAAALILEQYLRSKNQL